MSTKSFGEHLVDSVFKTIAAVYKSAWLMLAVAFYYGGHPYCAAWWLGYWLITELKPDKDDA